MTVLKRTVFNYILPLIGNVCKRSYEIPVIYYHDVVDDGVGYSIQHTDLSVFTRNMEYLHQNNYKTYLFDEIPDNFIKKSSSKEVIITFDDGFLSNYTRVLPIMQKYNLKFNIFLSAGYMQNRTEDYLSWSMVEEMQRTGIVGFGAHTYSHIDARMIDNESFAKEITENNNLIKSHTGIEVQDFCFPYGYYDNATIRTLCDKKSYKRLYTSCNNKITICNDSLIIGRTGISTDDSLRVFKNKVKGLYRIMYYYCGIRWGFSDLKG